MRKTINSDRFVAYKDCFASRCVGGIAITVSPSDLSNCTACDSGGGYHNCWNPEYCQLCKFSWIGISHNMA